MEVSDAPERADEGGGPVASVREPRPSSVAFLSPSALDRDLDECADAVELQAWLARLAAQYGARAACHLSFGAGAEPAVLIAGAPLDDEAAVRARAAAAIGCATRPALVVIAEEAGGAAVTVPVRETASAGCLHLSFDDAALAAWVLGGGQGALIAAAQRLHAVARRLAPACSKVLTDRELACLRLAASGETLSASAASLGVAPRTVEAHLARAARKLRAANKINAVAIAIDTGLLRV